MTASLPRTTACGEASLIPSLSRVVWSWLWLCSLFRKSHSKNRMTSFMKSHSSVLILCWNRSPGWKWRLGAEAAAGRWWVYTIGNLGRWLPNSLKIDFSLEEESVQKEQLVPDCSIIFWFSSLIYLTNAKDETASGFWLRWVHHEKESSGRVHTAFPLSRERTSPCLAPC